MKKGEAADFLPLIQALVDGKIIQHRLPGGEFSDCGWSTFSFDAQPEQYRIKPQPLEIVCMVNSEGQCLGNFVDELTCTEQIKCLTKDNPSMNFIDYKAVKFRQVMDD